MLGYAPQLLCGAHLMEARRNGHEFTFVDGRVCGVCEGEGRVHAQEVRTDSPGGAWLRCPECMGTGYDPILKLPSASQGNEGRERTRRQRPSSQESPGERRIREAEQRDARSQWFEREIAPLADRLPGRGTSREGQPPYTPPTTTSRYEYAQRGGGNWAQLSIPIILLVGLVGFVLFLILYYEDGPLRGEEGPANPGSLTPVPTFEQPTFAPPPTIVQLPTIEPPPIPAFVPLPTSEPTPTPVTQLTSDSYQELVELALGLINKDRADHGLPSLVLGSNPAAQRHANDMLEHDYQGHWWVDGSKPYMVYTRTGGTSYAAENAASHGWTGLEWERNSCGSFLVRCEVPSPEEAITELQWLMMYDYAHADWGHRDNILRESHRAVNIGVAANNRRMTFVQHFEGGAAAAVAPPVLSSDNRLSFEIVKREAGVQIGGVVSIYYDPPVTPKTPQAIDALDSYCLGGGFTTQCGDEVASILEPLGQGYSYSSLQYNEVVASSWSETAEGFSFAADMGTLLERPGVYTVVVWRDTGGTWLEEALIELSVFVG